MTCAPKKFPYSNGGLSVVSSVHRQEVRSPFGERRNLHTSYYGLGEMIKEQTLRIRDVQSIRVKLGRYKWNYLFSSKPLPKLFSNRTAFRLSDYYIWTLCECVSECVIISSPVIGQTVQKLVSHWWRMAAMFRSRVKVWGVGGKMLFTVQVCTNWFR